ncbi:MAG: MFS transporter [Deltaproteobacteria bacterium]|nr:MFS transporter [Deltaproteobacteria bacterium]
MPSGILITIIYITVLTFSALYAPQPLLHVLHREFGVGEATASLLITVTMLPLSLAPMVYGLLLENYSAKRIMVVAVSFLAGSELGIYWSNSFTQLLMIRFFQGMALPALMTSLMTYVSSYSTGRYIQSAMATYIAATIFGGFFGRLVSGFVSSHLGWRYSFLTLFLAFAVALIPLSRLKAETRAKFLRPRLADFSEVLRAPGFFRVYVVIFFSFFVFASLLNFLPFRLNELTGQPSEFRIALMYSGYLMGMVISLNSMRIIRILGDEHRAIRAGLWCYLAATLLFLSTIPQVLFAAMFLFCAGMFLVHAVAPGLLNRQIQSKRGLVNGLYISFYYAGGTLGSYFPGMIYQRFGWTIYILFLAAALGLNIYIALSLKECQGGVSRAGR